MFLRTSRWILPAFALATMILGATPASAALESDLPFIVEAEDYIAFNDIDGYIIAVVSCAAASNGLIVQGLDFPGEWIELSVNFPQSGFYEVQVGIQGLLGMEYELRTTIQGAGPQGEDLRAEFNYVGQGIG